MSLSPGADVDVAHDRLVRAGDLVLRALHEGEDLLGALAQDHALLRQEHLARALCAPDEQLLAQLLLQGAQLRGERRLGQVQGLRRRGDVLLPRNREEVLKHAQFQCQNPLSAFRARRKASVFFIVPQRSGRTPLFFAKSAAAPRSGPKSGRPERPGETRAPGPSAARRLRAAGAAS